ncbi:sulfurtransferase [Alphaproteobacteria bacterium LSUCC0684]
MSPLISAHDAIKLLGQDGVVFLDASYHLPNSGRDPEAEYLERRIPGAIRFDINTIADPTAELPHTMPTAPVFQRHMRALGLRNEDTIIVYDDSPFYSSARAWYMLRYFGHGDVRVLNGGLTAWMKAGGATEHGSQIPSLMASQFTCDEPRGNDGVMMLGAMRRLVDVPAAQRKRQVVDARSRGRFAGTEDEPRPGLASGHMPGAINIPIGSLIDRDTGLIKDLPELEEIFSILDKDTPVVTTCGSGVTACGLALGLAMIGREDVAIYDGSWSEWGSRPDCPVEQ